MTPRIAVGRTRTGRLVYPIAGGNGGGNGSPKIKSAEGDTLVIPTTAAELEAMLSDEKTMKAVFRSKETANDFISNYAKAVLDRDTTIATQVREETQRQVAAVLRNAQEEGFKPAKALDLRGGPDLPRGWDGATLDPMAIRRQKLFNSNAMGAKINDEFANSGEFFRAIWHNTERDAKLQAKLGRVKNAMSSSIPSEGGFLIPETLRSEILRVSLETAIVRPKARIVPMETLTVPFPAIDATSNAAGQLFGGITTYWTEEGAPIPDSKAKFSTVKLQAKKLAAMAEVPNELVSDAIGAFMVVIDELFPEAVTYEEDYAYLQGTGVGEPLGALRSPAAIEVAKEAGQVADTIVWENIVKAYARMLPSSLSRAVWLASIDTLPELMTMALSVGTGGGPILMGFGGGTDAPPMNILGRPVIFTEKVPKLGDAGDVSFVDFGFYLIGDRQTMTARSSEHRKFEEDKTMFRITERVDGQPWLRSAITPRNASATLSPVVKLAERA